MRIDEANREQYEQLWVSVRDAPAGNDRQSLTYILKEWAALLCIIFGCYATFATFTQLLQKYQTTAIFVAGIGPMLLLGAALLLGFRFSLLLLMLTLVLSGCLMCWTGAQY